MSYDATNVAGWVLFSSTVAAVLFIVMVVAVCLIKIQCDDYRAYKRRVNLALEAETARITQHPTGARSVAAVDPDDDDDDAADSHV